MRSDRPRRPSIKQRRADKRAKKVATEALARAKARAAERARRLRGQVLVDPALLRPTNSYSTPDFVEREFYVDRPFVCKDCGRAEVWTATQQKWWYEAAKGDVWRVAVRCRACRRRERERKAAARRIQREGMARKRAA